MRYLGVFLGVTTMLVLVAWGDNDPASVRQNGAIDTGLLIASKAAKVNDGDLKGTWLVFETPQGEAEKAPCCVFVEQQEGGINWLDWDREYSVSVSGTITGDSLSLAGESYYFGDPVRFSAFAKTDGKTMTGDYSSTGAVVENGIWRAEKSECKSLKGWVRQCNIRNQGYFLDFDVWDLIPEGIPIKAVTVAGPRIEGAVEMHSDGPSEYYPWVASQPVGATEPTSGEGYTFTVNYQDGAVDIVAAPVRGIRVGFPTPVSPADGAAVTTSTLRFSWDPPSCGCQGYYGIWVGDSEGGDRMWSTYLPQEATSVEYNSDGTGRPLIQGEVYEWRLTAYDKPILGGPDNYAQVSASFTYAIRNETAVSSESWGWIKADR